MRLQLKLKSKWWSVCLSGQWRQRWARFTFLHPSFLSFSRLIFRHSSTCPVCSWAAASSVHRLEICKHTIINKKPLMLSEPLWAPACSLWVTFWLLSSASIIHIFKLWWYFSLKSVASVTIQSSFVRHLLTEQSVGATRVHERDSYFYSLFNFSTCVVFMNIFSCFLHACLQM